MSNGYAAATFKQVFRAHRALSSASGFRVFGAMVLSLAAMGGAALQAQSVAVDPCATTPQNCPTLISTSATAQTRIPNTAVDVTLGLTVTQADLPAAQRALSTQSNQLIAYLRTQGVQRLITNNVSFNPETRFQKNAADKTVGYTGSTSVSFRTTPEKAPEILSGALSNGANAINSTMFTPTEQQIEDARRDLAAQATKTAMAQIESVAKAVNSHVVAVRDIQIGSVSGGEPRPMPMVMRAMKMDAAAAAPIATAEGDDEISLTVSLTAAVAR